MVTVEGSCWEGEGGLEAGWGGGDGLSWRRVSRGYARVVGVESVPDVNTVLKSTLVLGVYLPTARGCARTCGRHGVLFKMLTITVRRFSIAYDRADMAASVLG